MQLRSLQEDEENERFNEAVRSREGDPEEKRLKQLQEQKDAIEEHKRERELAKQAEYEQFLREKQMVDEAVRQVIEANERFISFFSHSPFKSTLFSSEKRWKE